MNNWKNRWEEFDWQTAVYLVALYTISVISLLYMSSRISGPVIGGDEMLYYSLARDFFKSATIHSEQYNPLYPILCSQFFRQGDYITAYKLIKIFNVFSFSSVIFPIYLVCSLVIKEKYWRYILSGIVIFLPWKMVVNLIWAEPLYYPLYAWSIFFFCLYLEKREDRILIFSSIFSGACFLAKQAGMLLIASIGVTILWLCLYERLPIKSTLKKILYFGIPAGGCMLALMIHNKLINVGIVGYTKEIDSIKENLFNIKDLFPNFMLNFSYYIIATGFIGVVLVIYLLLSITKLNNEEKALTLVISISCLLLIILCSYHYVGLGSTYGRYLTVIIPFMFILAVMALERLEMKRTMLIIINFVCMALVVLFNPFWQTMHAKGYINQQDLSVWNAVFMKGTMTYSAEAAKKVFADSNAHYYVMLFLFCISTLVIIGIYSKLIQRIGITLFMFCIVLLSFCANDAVTGKVMAAGNAMNELYQYLLMESIPVEKIYKVSSSIGNSACEDVWFERKINLADYSTLRYGQCLCLDFGGGNTPVVDGAYALKAPWEPKSFYDGLYTTIGFDHQQSIVDMSSTIDSLYSGITKNDGMNDAVYGMTDNTIYIDKPEGKYSVQMKCAPDLLIEGMELQYEVYVNGRYVEKIDSENTEIEFEVELEKIETNGKLPVIEIEVKPINGGYWQIALMNILDENEIINNRDIYIIANNGQEYDLPIVYKNKKYVVLYQE